MTDKKFSSTRRTMLTGSMAAAASLLTTSGFAPVAEASMMPHERTCGPLTYYVELRVAPPNKAAFDQGIADFGKAMQRKGALSLSLKQMVGDSTMVKNYPNSYKGLLRDAYAEAAQEGSLPLFYSLFVRFANSGALKAAHADAAFDQYILPHLHGMMLVNGKPTPKPMTPYRGVFETVLAGNRKGIYSKPEELVTFVKNPVDINKSELVTVENHVFVYEESVPAFDAAVRPLLKVAQETEQPNDGAHPLGLPGAADNLNYRKAVSTEIMRKVNADGSLRAYIMHGVWESVWDHENSHIDPRFRKAAGPVAAMVAIGPVEPFYRTERTIV